MVLFVEVMIRLRRGLHSHTGWTKHLGHKTVMDFLICTSNIPKVSNFMSDGVRLSRLPKFNKIGRFCEGNG